MGKIILTVAGITWCIAGAAGAVIQILHGEPLTVESLVYIGFGVSWIVLGQLKERRKDGKRDRYV